MTLSSYPAASLYPLVHVVGEGLAGHEASGALGGVEVPLLQDDPALADHHQGSAPHLHALKDVILHSLGEGGEGSDKEGSDMCVIRHIYSCV